MDQKAPKATTMKKAPTKRVAAKKAPPAKPKRVKLKNTRPGNGEIGGIAMPLEKDVPAWEQRGWVRA